MDRLTLLTEAIRSEGFTFVRAADMRALLETAGPLTDWTAFAASWDDLGRDTYMADGGRYRKRRHAVFSVGQEGIVRQPAQPHYQSRDYNTLNGGMERWFQPVLPEIGAGPSLTTVLHWCQRLFDLLAGVQDWFVEVHQFRIEARTGEAGQPTPEGMHRDGVDCVLVLLINRRNIASGVTSVHDLSGRTLGQFTLAETFDAALVDDQRVMHGVTPVELVDASAPAYRDVLVVTFRRRER
ncbi:MAG: 2OG-Fe dioxygenase family protein [Rhodopila sp.]